MKTFLSAFLAQLRRMFATPRYVVMLLLLIAAAWCSGDVYRRQVVADLPVAVVDLDNSKPSRAIRTFLHATKEVDVANDGTPLSLPEARAALEEGRLAAVVLIPDGLEAELKRGHKATVLVAIDGSNILVARNANKALARAIGTVSAGVQLQLVTRLGERRSRALARVVPVVASEEFSFNPWTSYGIYVVPPLVLFLLHVYAMLVFASLYLPLDKPRSVAGIAGAKAATALVVAVLAAIVIHGMLPALGIVARSGPGVMAASVGLWILDDLLWAAAMTSLIPSVVLAFQTTVVLTMVSMMFAGVTWPIDAMPPAIAAIAAALPFTPFAQAFQTFLHYPAGFDEVSGLLRMQALQAAAFAAVIVVAQSVRWLARRVLARPVVDGGAA